MSNVAILIIFAILVFINYAAKNSVWFLLPIAFIAYILWIVTEEPLKEWKQKRDRLKAEETRNRELADLPLRWTDARFPTSEAFARYLRAEYLKARDGQTQLLGGYLTQLIAAFTKLYEQEFPVNVTAFSRITIKLKDPENAFRLTMRVFLQGLINLTKTIHPHCLEQDITNPLFTVETNLRDTILGCDKEWYFKDKQLHAYVSLTTPFHDVFEELQQLDLFRWDYEPRVPIDEPNEDDFSTPLQYKAAKERYRKACDKVIEALPIYQQIFVNHPLYPIAQSLYPMQTVALPFHIDPERWFEGTWIVGAHGRGKSNLLRYLILRLQENATIVILDAKGDLLKTFERASFLKDRLVLIEPSLDHPPAINPLDMGGNAVEFLTYLFELLDTSMTPNQTTLFRLMLTLLDKVPNATLETFRDIIQNGWKPYERYVRELKPRDQDFFDKEFNTRVYNDRKPEVLLRLRLLLSNPYLEAMFLAPKTRINFGQLMDESKVVCVNNSYNPDMLAEMGSEFFGRTVIALIWAAARRRASRPDSEKKPVYVFIDEAHYVIKNDTTIAKIIQQCRSQRIAMIFAHQEIKQIDNEKVKNALNGCAIKFANTTGEAPEMASRLSTTPEFVKQQKRGQFAVYVLDKTDTAVSITVPNVPVHNDQTLVDGLVLPDSECRQLMTSIRQQFCWQPSHIDATSPTPPVSAAPPSEDSRPEEIG